MGLYMGYTRVVCRLYVVVDDIWSRKSIYLRVRRSNNSNSMDHQKQEDYRQVQRNFYNEI